MLARGHRVEIWAVPGSTILTEAAARGLPQRALPIGRKSLTGLFALRRAIVETHPDVINTHSSTDTWLAALATLSLRAAPPIVRTRHISAPVPRNLASRWLYQRAARHIVTTGERLRGTLIGENRFPPERITSVPTGIDTAQFHPGDRREARRQLGLDPDARYIGIIATLRSWKGHLYLLDAFARLAPAEANLHLLIVGDGPMDAVIQGRISELGLENKAHLVGRQDNVPRWLQALEVFCLPSYANEGVPQAVLQAMLTGLPVVTTPVGSIEEAIADGATGLLIPPRDSEALAAALRKVLNDVGLAQRLGAAARHEAVRRFGLDTMLDGMERVFRRVVEPHREFKKPHVT